jgi:hypothetical protein
MVKKDALTKEQRASAEGLLELAAKEGWKIETMEIKMRPYTDIANFLKRLKQAEDAARRSKIVFCSYAYNQFQPAY